MKMIFDELEKLSAKVEYDFLQINYKLNKKMFFSSKCIIIFFLYFFSLAGINYFSQIYHLFLVHYLILD